MFSKFCACNVYKSAFECLIDLISGDFSASVDFSSSDCGIWGQPDESRVFSIENDLVPFSGVKP